MRTLIPFTACAAGLLLGPTALAGRGDTVLVVDNDFDGAAEVWVDGRYEGAIRGDARVGFSIRPGNRSVSIQRPSGYTLLTTRVHAHPGSQVRVDVEPPRATLAVRNPGHDRLWVRVDGRSVALSPHGTVDLRVDSGDVDLVVEVRDRYGSHVVDRRTVWVEPGRPKQVAVRHDSSPVRHDSSPVRVGYHPSPPLPHVHGGCGLSAAVAWVDDDDDDDDDRHHGRRRGRDRD